MRNLKRALCFALAAVMVLGLMITGAGAASTYDNFTDKDEIVHQEAVNTMVSLGVISGKEDGSYFDPSATVTRAEMTKVVAVALNGGKDPVFSDNDKTTFSDTQGHWAEKYIAYCVRQGIVAGRGDNSFGPDDPLTGSACAKMFLCALGYRADLEGFVNVGNDWELNVNVKANQDANLYDGLSDIKASDPLSRDSMAQMLYNAVQADEVIYDNLYGDYSGVVQAVPINKNNEHNSDSTMLWNRFKVQKVEGIVVATDIFSINNNPAADGKIRLANVYVNNEREATADGAYTVDLDKEYVGKKVVLYVKYRNALAPNASDSEVISEPFLSDDNIVVETSKRLEDNDDVRDVLKGSGLAVNSDTSAILVDSKGSHTGVKTGITTSIGDETTATGTGTGRVGVHQTFIDNNNDGKVEYIIQVNADLSKVNSYNTKDEKLNLAGIGSVDFEDIDNAGDVEMNDYVLVTKFDDTYFLAQPETVSGEVTAYINGGTAKITLDGTNYALSTGENKTSDLDKLVKDDMSDLVDGGYTLYLDPYGNILAYTEDEAALGNYALITNINPSGSSGFRSVEVKLLMSDGTTGKYDVNLLASAKKWSDSTSSPNSNTGKEEAMYSVLNAKTNNIFDEIGTIVTYSMDGNNVTLGRPMKINSDRYHETDTTNNLKLQNSVAGYQFTNGKVMTDDKTVFFIKDARGEYTAVNGLRNLRSSALDTTGTSVAVYYTAVNSTTMVAKALYAEVTENYSSSSNYAYITGNYTKTSEGTDTIYSYPVVFEDGTTGTLKSKSDDGIKDAVNEYQMDGNYVTFNNDTSNLRNTKIVTGVGANAVSVANASNPKQGKDSFPTSGAKVWNVEDDENVYATNLTKNDLVALVLDDDGNVKTAYVYDRQDDDLTADVSASLTASAGTLEDDSKWTGAASGNTLTLSFTLGANQEADLKVSKTSAATGAVSGNSTTYTTAGAQSVTVYTAGADENGGKVTVTLTVKDTSASNKKLDRVISYEVEVSSTKAPVSDISVVTPTSKPLTLGNLNGTAYNATTNKTLTAGNNTLTTTGFVSGTADAIQVDVTAKDGETATAALTVKTKPASATSPVDGSYTPGSSITFSHAGTYEMVLAVTTSKAGFSDTVTEYNLTVIVGLAAGTAPTSAVTAAHGAVVTDGATENAKVTYADTGEEISLALTQASATAMTITGVQVNGLTAAGVNTTAIAEGKTLTSSAAAKVYTVQAADGGKTGTIAITVEITETGKDPVVKTYTISISCNKAAAPAPTVTITTSTGNIARGPVTFTANAAEIRAKSLATGGGTINLDITPASGTTLNVSMPSTSGLTWDANGGILTVADSASTNGALTITVSGEGYQISTYTITIDVTT